MQTLPVTSLVLASSLRQYISRIILSAIETYSRPNVDPCGENDRLPFQRHRIYGSAFSIGVYVSTRQHNVLEYF